MEKVTKNSTQNMKMGKQIKSKKMYSNNTSSYNNYRKLKSASTLQIGRNFCQISLIINSNLF